MCYNNYIYNAFIKLINTIVDKGQISLPCNTLFLIKFQIMNLQRIVSTPLAIAAIATLGLNACKKPVDDNVTTVNKKVTIQFNNVAGDKPITYSTLSYGKISGCNYSVTLLKYYVSYFTLVKDDNTEYNFKNHDLINQADSSSLYFSNGDVPNGTYTKVKFYLGVDPEHNSSGLQDGELDPSYDMIWTWSTGYMFFKHEGLYKGDTGIAKGMAYHFGTANALSTITIAIPPMVVDQNTVKTIGIKFDLDSLYTRPNPIDFRIDNVRHSTSIDDQTWLANLKANFATAFKIEYIR